MRRCKVGVLIGTFSLEMILKFVAPLFHDADRRQRRGVAKRAETAAEYVLRKLADQIDVFRVPPPS